MRKYSGYVIEDKTIERIAFFRCFGEMSDGMKCYHELDATGEEVEGKWYSMSKQRINGSVYTIFFMEGLE